MGHATGWVTDVDFEEVFGQCIGALFGSSHLTKDMLLHLGGVVCSSLRFKPPPLLPRG